MVARRLRQDEQYLTVREILSEPSTGAGGMLSRERSDFCRFGFATLGFSLSGACIRLSQQLNFSAEIPLVLARIFHELLSRDHEDGRATGQPQGVGPEAYPNGTSQGPTPEDARKEGHIRGRSKPFMKHAG